MRADTLGNLWASLLGATPLAESLEPRRVLPPRGGLGRLPFGPRLLGDFPCLQI